FGGGELGGACCVFRRGEKVVDIRPKTLEPRVGRHRGGQALPRIHAGAGLRLGEERRSCAWRRRYPPRTPAPRSPRRSTAGKAGTYPSRVRANRVERPAALPAPHRRAAFGLPSDRRTLSCVSDRTRYEANCRI